MALSHTPQQATQCVAQWLIIAVIWDMNSLILGISTDFVERTASGMGQLRTAQVRCIH